MPSRHQPPQRPQTLAWTAAVLLLVVLMGCADDRADIEARVSLVEASVLYRDPEGLWKIHVESVGQGPFCAPHFKHLFGRTAKKVSAASCRQAATLTHSAEPEVDTLDDEARLLIEVIDHQCKHPGASCKHFARARFERKLTASRLWQQTVETLSTHKVHLEGDDATAYVDVAYRNDTKGDRIALHFRRLDKRWMLTSYPW